MSQPTFIVGTGRCGSTLLSGMFRRHRLVASFYEFFTFVCDIGGCIPDEFPGDEIDGGRFWNLLSAIGPRLNLSLRQDIAMPEIVYPYRSPAARFSAQSGVPVILQATLPHLTSDPDALFDELREFVLPRPIAPIRAHYDALFDWLVRRFHKRIWVERSGGVFVILEPIYHLFPDARFIHIVRDGRDTAISIREHCGFRLFILATMLTEMLGVDPFYSADRTNLERVPPPLRAFLPESFDPEVFRNYRIPLAACGQLWSQQIAKGLQVLSRLPPPSVCTVRYEDLLREPAVQIQRIAKFLGEEFVDQAWAESCASMVRKPQSAWQSLNENEAAELAAACQPASTSCEESESSMVDDPAKSPTSSNFRRGKP